ASPAPRPAGGCCVLIVVRDRVFPLLPRIRLNIASPRSRPERTPMAKFLRIGVHHSNVSGYTSKAWTIRRVGSTVLLKWGSVEVRGAAHGRRIYWAGRPRQKTVRYGSEKRARDYVRKAVTRRLGHQYERLLEKVRIRRRPVRHQVEPARVLA